MINKQIQPTYITLNNELRKRVDAILNNGRVDWADYAKGICIFFVVMMHATLGVESHAGQEGWMHYVVAFAKPFRMPDFFMISGLFLALTIDKPWLRYIDRKVIHFIYFYILWLTIIYAFKAPQWYLNGEGALSITEHYLEAFIEPYGTLWFIYLLPIFFIVTRLLKNVPTIVLLGFGAILQTLPIHTGSMVIDEFASRYVYFLAGYLLAPYIFDLAAWTKNNPIYGFGLFIIWALVNGLLVFAPMYHVPTLFTQLPQIDQFSDLPIVSLLLGISGACAIVVSAALLTNFKWTRLIAFMGANSIVVYLAFTFPNSIFRAIFIKFSPFDIGTISLLVTIISVAVPLILFVIIRRTGYGIFLFERPQWARLERQKPKLSIKQQPINQTR